MIRYAVVVYIWFYPSGVPERVTSVDAFPLPQCNELAVRAIIELRISSRDTAAVRCEVRR